MQQKADKDSRQEDDDIVSGPGHYDSLILQPSVIDITRVIVCFSTPVNSITSPSGSLIVGNFWIIRTIV